MVVQEAAPSVSRLLLQRAGVPLLDPLLQDLDCALRHQLLCKLEQGSALGIVPLLPSHAFFKAVEESLKVRHAVSFCAHEGLLLFVPLQPIVDSSLALLRSHGPQVCEEAFRFGDVFFGDACPLRKVDRRGQPVLVEPVLDGHRLVQLLRGRPLLAEFLAAELASRLAEQAVNAGDAALELLDGRTLLRYHGTQPAAGARHVAQRGQSLILGRNPLEVLPQLCVRRLQCVLLGLPRMLLSSKGFCLDTPAVCLALGHTPRSARGRGKLRLFEQQLLLLLLLDPLPLLHVEVLGVHLLLLLEVKTLSLQHVGILGHQLLLSGQHLHALRLEVFIVLLSTSINRLGQGLPVSGNQLMPLLLKGHPDILLAPTRVLGFGEGLLHRRQLVLRPTQLAHLLGELPVELAHALHPLH
mmetsp:Transcript_118823/g.379059  ORF Transcript_118823/g.379059 Transcript_118823/m.379059 type:complete len:411 (+) Transcript_118823:884-2116(+)